MVKQTTLDIKTLSAVKQTTLNIKTLSTVKLTTLNIKTLNAVKQTTLNIKTLSAVKQTTLNIMTMKSCCMEWRQYSPVHDFIVPMISSKLTETEVKWIHKTFNNVKWIEAVAVGQTLRSISRKADMQLLNVFVTLTLSPW